MSTKRIYRIKHDVFWKPTENKKHGFWMGVDFSDVHTTADAKDAIFRFEQVKAKERLTDTDEKSGKKTPYVVGKIDIVSAELLAESEIG